MSSWGLNRDQKFYLWQCLKKLPLSLALSLLLGIVAAFYASVVHGIVLFMLLMAGAILRVAYQTMDFKYLYYASDQIPLNVGRIATVILFFALCGCVGDIIYIGFRNIEGVGWENHIGLFVGSILGVLACLAFAIIGFLSDKLGWIDKEPF